MSIIKRLINRRRALRHRIEEVMDTAMAHTEDVAATTESIHGHIDILTRHERNLTDLQTQVVDAIDDPNLEAQEFEDNEVFMDRLIQVLSALTCRRNRKEEAEQPRRVNDAVVNVQQPVQAMMPRMDQTSKLPTLDLPKFNGDPLNWTSFWDAYNASIHSRGNIQDVEKFNHLRSLLKGIAADSIGGLAVTNANYPVAINLIQERFGQDQIIVEAHVESLINLPKTSMKTSKLRALYDQVEKHLKGMEALGIDEGVESRVLAAIVFAKLPDEMRSNLTLQNGTRITDLGTLRPLLRMQIEAREVNQVSKKPSQSCPLLEETRYSTGALLNQSSFGKHRKDRFGPNCKLCKATNHWASDCSTYKTSQQRLTFVREKRLCENCLSPGHFAKFCKSKYSCRKCNQRHHQSLCGQDFNVHSNGNTVAVATSEVSPMLLTSSSSILMQTAKAKIRDSSGNWVIVRLLFDTGSHRSYVTSALALKLSLKKHDTEILSIAPFGQKKSIPQKFDVTSVICENLHGNTKNQITTIVTPIITCPIYRARIKSKESLKNVQLADPFETQDQWMDIDILIGLDHYWEIVDGSVLRIPDSQITLVSSSFGWLVSGKTQGDPNHNTRQANVLLTEIELQNQENFLKKFWESENLPNDSENYAMDHDVVLKRFENSIEKKDNRYEVALPWKDDIDDLPDNYGLSKTRFKRLVIRLNRENLTQQYHEVIVDQLNRDFIEPIDDSLNHDGKLHYISHHPVLKNEHATTKLRIVYDASAKASKDKPSLNDCLHTGPNIIGDLMHLLLEFRSHKNVLLADIEKAFLQVSLNAKDRDATRFFWLKDPSKPATEDNVQIYRFKRVLFGATCSPFLLAATLRHHLRASGDPVATNMLERFYVDNLVTGTETTDEATLFYEKAKAIMDDAGINLREWTSNNEVFMSSIPDKDRAKGNTFKVLGIDWHCKEDIITVKETPRLEDLLTMSKRNILQTIARIFDPLGITSPVVIRAKMYMQSLWKDKLTWDEQPPTELLNEWFRITSDLSDLSNIQLSRRLEISKDTTLHVFVDALPKAYGAVAYIRTEGGTVQLVCSKSRVASLKTPTIPRLELMAALLGVKLVEVVLKALDRITDVILWSDSQVVLYWIKESKTKEMYVLNRIKLINDSGFPFRYCPTADNPADLISRGKTTAELLDPACIWWKRPQWLRQNPISFPEWIPENDVSKNGKPQTSVLPTIVNKLRDPDSPFGINPKRFSKLEKLLRVTAQCQRFIQRCKKNQTQNGEISTEELNVARTLWIKSLQQKHFSAEFKALRQKTSTDRIRQMNLFERDNVLRCRGRLQNANLQADTNTPFILPRTEYVTDLFIDYEHRLLLSAGTNHTLTSLRQFAWIPSGRQQVRSVLKNCFTCRRWQGQSYGSGWHPPQLPTSRVTKSPPFTFTGVDFAGPLYIKSKTLVEKRYICLFTCAVTRAVHLELVNDLTTSTFLMALRKFVARRGVPQVIISDNAKTFKMAAEFLTTLWEDVLSDPEMQHYLTSRGIKWQFIIERAPWWGGFYEKMVGLTKRALIKSIGKSKLNSIELVTLLTEVEAVLNTRPITTITDDEIGIQPLRPMDFLTPASSFTIPTPMSDIDDPVYEDTNVPATQLFKKLQQRQKYLDNFWRTWSREYLTGLREIHHRSNKQLRNNASSEPKEGNIVLVKEDNVKRIHWKLGRIDQLYKFKDDEKVQAVKLEVNEKEIQRPVSALYPFEVRAERSTDITISSTTIKEDTVQKNHRPQRLSAIKARVQEQRSILIMCSYDL